MDHFAFQPSMAAGMFPSLLFKFVEVGCGSLVLAFFPHLCAKTSIGAKTPIRAQDSDTYGTHGIPPEFCGGVHLFILNRHTPSG